jgi:hypothetical protein
MKDNENNRKLLDFLEKIKKELPSSTQIHKLLDEVKEGRVCPCDSLKAIDGSLRSFVKKEFKENLQPIHILRDCNRGNQKRLKEKALKFIRLSCLCDKLFKFWAFFLIDNNMCHFLDGSLRGKKIIVEEIDE